MKPRCISRILIAALVPASIATAQAAPRQLSLVQDGHIDIARAGGARDVLVVPGPGGRTLLVPRAGWGGEMTAYDSAGCPAGSAELQLLPGGQRDEPVGRCRRQRGFNLTIDVGQNETCDSDE